MLTDMMPWMSDMGRYALLAVGSAAGLAVLWFGVKFVRFMRTAV